MTTQKIPVPTVRHGGDTFSYKLITYRQKNHKSIAFIKRNRQQTAVGAKAPLPDLALFPPKLGATGESERREPCLRSLLRTLVPGHPSDFESGYIQICLRMLRPCAISRVSQFEDPSPRPSPRQGSGRGRNPYMSPSFTDVSSLRTSTTVHCLSIMPSIELLQHQLSPGSPRLFFVFSVFFVVPYWVADEARVRQSRTEAIHCLSNRGSVVPTLHIWFHARRMVLTDFQRWGVKVVGHEINDRRVSTCLNGSMTRCVESRLANSIV